MQSTIHIQNLKCGGCASTIKNKVSELEGVAGVEVDTSESTVRIDYSGENVLLKAKQKLAVLGYPEVDAQNGLITQVKSFVSCAVGRLSK